MNNKFYFAGLLALSVFLPSPPVFAQASETAPPPAVVEDATTEEPEAPASQEVEINEDNYRQFMELKDANRQRDIVPEDMFKPDTGLQKLEKLPEASQKHLRNELREIIVQGDPWQPGDEDKEFPYVPSAAASTDPALEKQELEAWGELVNSYNQREAQIYENSSGSQAAMGSEQGSSGNPERGAGQPGSTDPAGEGSQGQQAGQENKPDQNDDTGSYSPNASKDPNARNTAGVSQNAKEFLQGLGQGGNGASEGDQKAATGNGQGDDSPTPATGPSQAQTSQQDSTEQRNDAISETTNSTRDPNAKSTAGASQNAMEFLKGNAGQGERQSASGSNSSAASVGLGESQDAEAGQAAADGQQNGQNEGQEDGTPDAQETAQQGGQTDDQGEGQAEGQADSQDNGQSQDGQQAETAKASTPVPPPGGSTTVSTAESEEESTAGAAQNALEYLQGESTQTTDNSNNESAVSQPEGTLSIQDLLNARGVGGSTGTVPATAIPDDEQQPDEKAPGKDGKG